MRSRIDDAEIRGAILRHANRFGVSLQTLTGTYSIPSGAPHVQMLVTGGSARTVKLPASPKKGDWFLIVNLAAAADVITVQDSAAAALTPACTPTQNEAALVIYSGDATIGWRSVVMLGA